MKLKWKLDREEPLDSIDILGDLIILGDNGTQISIGVTYLDSWFSLLKEGLVSLSNGRPIEIEAPEEPMTISFSLRGEGGAISCNGLIVTFPSIQLALDNLRVEMNALLSEYNGIEGYNENEFFDEIKMS